MRSKLTESSEQLHLLKTRQKNAFESVVANVNHDVTALQELVERLLAHGVALQEQAPRANSNLLRMPSIHAHKSSVDSATLRSPVGETAFPPAKEPYAMGKMYQTQRHKDAMR